MTKRKPKYEEMSDFEINCLVACQFNGHSGQVSHMKNGVKALDSTGIFYSECDYCNNPSDAWPIILGNEISLTVKDGLWMADIFYWNFSSHYRVQTFHYDKNPLRAAMICFLKINGQAND